MVSVFDKFSAEIIELNSLEQQILTHDAKLPDGAPLNSGIVESVTRQRSLLQEKFRNLQKDAGQNELEAELIKGAGHINTLRELIGLIKSIDVLCALAGGTGSGDGTECKTLWWDRLIAEPLDTIDPFRDTVRTAKERLENQHKGLGIAEAGPEPGSEVRWFELGVLPEIGTVTPMQWARLRLGLYELISWLVTVVILTLVGFSQLYLANPTFGRLATTT